MALIKEYFELTKKFQDEYGENTILLMQVGSFFEVYGIYSQKTELISGSKIAPLPVSVPKVNTPVLVVFPFIFKLFVVILLPTIALPATVNVEETINVPENPPLPLTSNVGELDDVGLFIPIFE